MTVALPVTAARRRVLVVDDERYNRELLERTLARHADVVLVDGVAAALAALAAGPFDVILTDQRLVDGTGVELATRARALAPAARIVIVTGWSDDPAVHAARAAGTIDDVLTKPFAPIVLRERVLG